MTNANFYSLKKKYTLLFTCIKDLVAFQKRANPEGYVMVPQVHLISASFSEPDIEIAIRLFHAEIILDVDINLYERE
ncbi:MAG: hypothetical protein NVS1B13_15630 [Flavisolibacter sp.]